MDEFDEFKKAMEHTKQAVAHLSLAMADAQVVIKNSPSLLAYHLPGVKEMVVNPASKKIGFLIDVIMDLNDYHKWTREEIADWLDTLDIDLTFKEKNEQDR